MRIQKPHLPRRSLPFAILALSVFLFEGRAPADVAAATAPAASAPSLPPGIVPGPALDAALERLKAMRPAPATDAAASSSPLPNRTATSPQPATAPVTSVEAATRQLDRMRAGRATDFAAVDALANKFLAQFPAEKDQASIYYELAFIDSQSGLPQPERTIDYVKKSLRTPLEAKFTGRLYLIWGDAIQLAMPKSEQREERRKLAVIPYLQGLNAIDWQKLPQKAPPLPGVFKYDDEPGSPTYDRIKREHDDAEKARNEAVAQGELVLLRKALIQQISSLYTQNLDEWQAELTDFAKTQLGSQASADALLTAIKQPATGRGR